MKPRRVIWAGIMVALALAFGLWAGETRRWEYNRFDQWSKGKLTNLELSSLGQLRPVWNLETKPADCEGIWSMAVGKGGELYLGTGNKGKLLLFQNGSFKELYSTGKVAITKIRLDKNGNVWFAAIPGGTIYRRNSNGEVTKVVETGENYVWDFLLQDGIIAATGPKGKILRYSETGQAKGVIETGETNVMTLLQAGDGKLYAGTADEGLVLEITPSGKPLVVQDFDEKEVRSLLWVGEGKSGTIIAAVNSDAGSRPPSASPASRPTTSDDEDSDEGEKGGEGKSEVPISEGRPAPQGGGMISGAVYALSPTGSARLVLDLPKRAAVDMVTVGSDIYVATDQQGKVYRCRLDTGEYAISFDLAPSQVLSLVADQKGLLYLGAGAPGALVLVKKGRAEKASWTSQVLDARFPAKWGAVSWVADDQVRILSRSGNISNPERGWSEWEAAGAGKTAQLKSPAGRYLQVKVEWPAGSEAELRSLSIPYRNFNQPHTVDLVIVESADKDTGERREGGAPPPHQTLRKIAWKVNNPDEDELAYTLFFQPEGVAQWIPIPLPKPLSKNNYVWETASIPDGWFRIKVVATDRPSNPPEEAFEASGISERFLIDNTPPEIKGLSASGRTVSGKIVDALSPISGLQFSIDGDTWQKLLPEDGVLDSPEESFKILLPETLAAGPHVIMIRGWDRALNLASGHLLVGKTK